MDIVSYSVAAKQKQRIEKVIANPDSTSGIVTTPSIIAAGETVTIPAGRTAVLPNTTVNGTLVVDGEVFIPSGSSYTATNINVSGVGSRITGDFTNAIIANRTFVQASQENGVTNLQTIPNGTAQLSGFLCFNNSNPTNSSWGHLRVDASTVALNSGVSGTGAYLPITFVTGGAERMRIDTAGNVGIGTTNTGLQSEQLHIANSTAPKFMLTNTIGYSWSILVPTNNGELKFKYEQGNITPLTIDRNGNVLFNNGTFGYGTGAGGTVTQLTSKSTAVTLNKPCGQITMSNAALAAGATVGFIFNNSAIGANDTFKVCITNANGVNVLNYEAEEHVLATGVGYIKVKNLSASALAETLVFNFTVIKGATV